MVKFKRQKVAVAVAAGDSEWRPGNLHARSDDISGIDRIPKRDVGIPFCANVANCGESSHQREAGVFGADESRARSGNAQAFVSSATRVESEMGVNVEEAG